MIVATSEGMWVCGILLSSYPDGPAPRLVDTVCRILESAWDVAVLCDCRQRQEDPLQLCDCRQHQEDPCRFTCYQSSCTALGYSLLRGEGGGGTAFVQHSALTHNWGLKLGPPLIIPSGCHPTYLSGILLGMLSNAREWCRTWASELLSLTVWLQVATVSRYTAKQVKKAAHSAVVRGLSTSPHEASRTVRYMYDVVPHHPMQHCCTITYCLHWLHTHAHWRGGRYSSWVIPETLSPNGTTGTWCDDWQLLRENVRSGPPCTNQCCETLPTQLEDEPSMPVCVCVCEQAVYACLKEQSSLLWYQSQHESSVVFHDNENTPLPGYRGMIAEAERVTKTMRTSGPSNIPLCTTRAKGERACVNRVPKYEVHCTHSPLCYWQKGA